MVRVAKLELISRIRLYEIENWARYGGSKLAIGKMEPFRKKSRVESAAAAQGRHSAIAVVRS
jgi:hypothetical protein